MKCNTYGHKASDCKVVKKIEKVSTRNKSAVLEIKCFKCGKVGYKAYACLLNKSVSTNVKKIWVPKGTIVTNLKRPKLAWVPKVKT